MLTEPRFSAGQVSGTSEAAGHRTDVTLAFTESTVWVRLPSDPSPADPRLLEEWTQGSGVPCCLT